MDQTPSARRASGAGAATRRTASVSSPDGFLITALALLMLTQLPEEDGLPPLVAVTAVALGLAPVLTWAR
ncbi:hypothetical protein ABZZ79_06995 [Streptomyces sp. NPDC006458]|uniref:hypothetical protein n=1 Tax=Streptomyces sp. NPDC006458 TaxID=3154302 RepID=UPI0033B750E6